MKSALVEAHLLMRDPKLHCHFLGFFEKPDEKCSKKLRFTHSWMRLVDSSNTEDLGASEVPQSRGKLFFQETQLLLMF